MEIKKENIVRAYSKADDSVKKVLCELFPEAQLETAHTADKRPIIERIKTFQDAREVLGEEHRLCRAWKALSDDDAEVAPDVEAYLKLRIICAALNEGWEPQFTEDEVRWYPWHWLYTQDEIDDMEEDEKTNRHMMSTGDYQTEYAGFACAISTDAPSAAGTAVGSRLCLKSDTLAVYCGKQFIDIWADFKLIRTHQKMITFK